MWVRELCYKNNVNFVSLQETKTECVDLFTSKVLWGNFTFDYAISPSVGNSGGIICIWEPSIFVKENVTGSNLFLLITDWNGKCIIIGDFNEVRTKEERFGSKFNTQDAFNFNNFILSTSLVDLSLGGYSLTWAHKTATKMSKLDGYLILDELLTLFPHLPALSLDRHFSDHRPILLKETYSDYSAIHFRLFHSWFQMDGFDKMVEETWTSMNIAENNGLVRLKKLLLDQGGVNTESLNLQMYLMKYLNDLNDIEAMEVAQKPKVRWSIEGDENTKYFHGILNKKRSQLSIRGVLVDGEWVNDPGKGYLGNKWKNWKGRFLMKR
ncbi:RNA-directed DNA polymerase, eukaryota [Tanacetum coccineum]